MNRLSILSAALLGCGLLMLATPSRADPSPSAGDPAIQAQIASAVQSDRAFFGGYGGKNPVPGVLVGVWDGNGGSYIHAFGYADLATHRKLTPQDHFRIGSITKTFVATVVLQLADAGKLSLDDPLSKFGIGVTIPNARNITVRELLNMSSGLYNFVDLPEFTKKISPETQFDPRAIVKLAVAQKPYFAPGTGFHYSNTNYIILGLIVEHITGQTIGEQIDTRLLQPYHLTGTSYPSTLAMPAPASHGYRLTSDKIWTDTGSSWPISLAGSAGSMVSTLADMKRWVFLYYSGATNAPATQAARLACHSANSHFGYGLGIICTNGWFGHGGLVPGYGTTAFYDPAQKITIVVLVNLGGTGIGADAATAIFQDVAAIMTPDNVPF